MQSKKKVCHKCQLPKIIWKNIEGKKYCKECSQKVSPIQLSKIHPKPFKTIGKSSTQEKLEIAYKVIRDQYLKIHPMCQAHLPGCTLKSSEVHHKRGRGEYLLNTTTYLAVCRSCHNWIEKNAESAKELGFSESRLQINTETDGC